MMIQRRIAHVCRVVVAAVAKNLPGLLVCVGVPAHAQQPGEMPLVPESVPLHESVEAALAAEWLTPEERAAMRLFHGVWDDRDLADVDDRARVALSAWRLDEPSLREPGVPAVLRAEAQLRAGELQKAVRTAGGVNTIAADRIRAEALEQLGEFDAALRATDQSVERLLNDRTNDPDVLTDGVRVLIVRARLQGQPSRDFQTMMDLLATARQDFDRLHWPSRLVEAELLFDKDDAGTAVEALHEVLQLNPRASEAWYLLGRIALKQFDFPSAESAAETLRRFNRAHPLADLLMAESRLIQDDPDGAMELLQPLLDRWPRMRPALELFAAAEALYYDEKALRAALAHYEELSPGSARAYYVVGHHLSMNRQYALAAEMLEEAIRRQPAWPAPQIEQGLMELQSGRDAVALRVLRDVVALDPFNKRALNSLTLLEELADYRRVETENFIIRHKPGVDRVLVDMMSGPLEELHHVVTNRFGFTPDRKTVIEVMPNHQRFAVRITGMPFIHTIAACTGPVIAMEVPREGTGHSSIYDWVRVVRHEYTHTITLAQTRNRIPHWLTEAAAVSMELAPRDYEKCQLLARAYEEGSLFDLDEIKWAFVRPKRPEDRGKAYAQGHWMLEYMNERFGESAVIRLFERYFDGDREAEAFPRALGLTREQFYDDFLEWAGAQVKSWGFAAEPPMSALLDELRWADPDLAVEMAASQQARLEAIARVMQEEIGQPVTRQRRPLTADRWPPLRKPAVEISNEQLDTWLAEYPDHPDLVELKLRRTILERGELHESVVPLLERYAALRPVDPLPHRRLAQLHLSGPDRQQAIPHLEELDIREEYVAVYAIELAKLYREAGDLPAAMAKAQRALHINPYHAPSRELAAAIAVEARRLDEARSHIVALTMIEPDRPQHQKRLEAIDRLLKR